MSIQITLRILKRLTSCCNLSMLKYRVNEHIVKTNMLASTYSSALVVTRLSLGHFSVSILVPKLTIMKLRVVAHSNQWLQCISLYITKNHRTNASVSINDCKTCIYDIKTIVV